MKAETTAVLKDLGRRVKEIRRSRQLTQEALAEKLAMLPSNYARIEQGRMNATVDTLVRIAKALKVSVSDLFTKPESKRSKVGRPRNDE